MRREDALLYACCCQDLSAARVEQIGRHARENIAWPEVFTLAQEHGVAPIVHRNLEAAIAAGLCVPDEILRKFRLATYRNITVKSRQAERLANMLAYLHDRSVDVMAIKGAALDLLVYDEPWYTVAQDIDLVLRPRRAQSRERVNEEFQHRLAGQGFEYELDEHHDMTLNGALAVDFGQVWRDATVADFHGLPLYLMAPEDMLLAVCINSCRKRYFRLRSLVDIAETVKRLPALDWSTFSHKAIEYDCNNIAYTALAVTAATVGCLLPCHVMDNLAIGPSRRRLVDGVIRFLLHNVTLRSLSCYTGGELIGRRFGWSLLLPYTAYHWPQRVSKIREALTAFSVSNS